MRVRNSLKNLSPFHFINPLLIIRVFFTPFPVISMINTKYLDSNDGLFAKVPSSKPTICSFISDFNSKLMIFTLHRIRSFSTWRKSFFFYSTIVHRKPCICCFIHVFLSSIQSVHFILSWGNLCGKKRLRRLNTTVRHVTYKMHITQCVVRALPEETHFFCWKMPCIRNEYSNCCYCNATQLQRKQQNEGKEIKLLLCKNNFIFSS